MKKKLPIDKKLAIVSTILIIVATFGFTFLDYHIQSTIDELKVSKSDYLEKQMMSFDFIKESNYHIKDSYILDGHYHIIKLIDSKNKYLLDSLERKIIQIRKNAVIMAFNSAISSEQIDRKDSEVLLEEIDSLKLKEELSDKYRYYAHKGADGTKDLQKIIEKINNNISEYTTIENKLWKICLILQSTGMLFAIWAIVHRRR